MIFLSAYEKKGYLTDDFKFFYLEDKKSHTFSYHYHEFDKIIIFLKGRVDYLIEGKTYPLFPHDIIFVSRNDLHKPIIDPNESYERIILYIAPGFLDRYKKDKADLYHCFHFAKKTQTHIMRFSETKFEQLITPIYKLNEALAADDFAKDLYVRLLFLEFFVLLNRAVGQKPLTDPAARYDKKTVELLTYINENLFNDLAIEKLSQKFYISKYYMMRKFKSETGYTLHQYILHKRLLLCRDFIRQEIPLTKICFDCGFKDYSTFSRAFKALFHCTPREYKKNLR